MKEEIEISKMLPESIVNAMSEESLSVLKEEFEKAVESKVAARVKLAVESAETALDEELNRKCTDLVHQIEEAHKIGLMKVVESINKRFNKKLEIVRNYYKSQLGRKAGLFKNSLVESVKNYINSRVDKLVPYEEVKEAVANNTAMKVLNTFKEILNVSEASSNKSIKGAIMEGYNMLVDAKNKVSSLESKNKELNSVIDEMAENYAFERNISKLDEDTKNFIIRFAKKMGVAYVNENMEYICSLYESKLSSEREYLKKKEIVKRKSKIHNINRRVLAEQNNDFGKRYMSDEDDAINQLIESIQKDNN